MPEIKFGMAFLSENDKTDKGGRPHHTATVIIIPTVNI